MQTPTRQRAPLGLRPLLLLGLASVTVLAILTTGYLALWAAGDTLRVDRETHASAIAAAVARSLSTVLSRQADTQEGIDVAVAETLLRHYADATPAVGLSVMGLDRKVLASYPARDPRDGDAPVLTTALAGGPPVINYRTALGDGSRQLLAYAPIDSGGKILGVARVVFDATAPTQTVLRRSGLVLLVLVVLDAALVLSLGYVLLTQLVVRPLRQLRRATDVVGAGDLRSRVEVSGAKEIVDLASAFERMTVSIASQREQLIRSEKLASVGRLAAGVAHEIGNPLATILGYVDILRSEGEGRSEMPAAERLDALLRVKAETQRIHHIIRDLLDYSRPSNEQAVPADPLKVLRTALGLLSPQPRFRAVKVMHLPDAAMWPTVLAVENRLAQVFLNLLGNAADAMGGKGGVIVTCEAREDRVVITFKDDGPGVPQDIRGRIFDPFFTTKDVGQGTGLGLSISRSIVENMGGSLELAEGTGTGAAFVITLPKATGQAS